MENKANIIDFFTWKSLREIARLSNEEEAELNEKGKYLGVLIKRDAEGIRATTEQLNLKKEQIEHLMREYNDLQQYYSELLSRSLLFLGRDNPEAKKVDIQSDAVFVDIDGHVWTVHAGLVNKDES